MTRNIGFFDRYIRIAAGIALLLATVVGPKTLWGLVGIVPLATGLMRFCPIYRLFGFSTCPMGQGH